MEPMSRLLQIRFAGTELLTGLPEYRNGGLLVDTGLLTLKEADMKRGLAAFRNNSMLKGQQTVEVIPLFATDDDVIVEWRAVTIGFLDELLIEVNGLLGLTGADQLSLAQMLEAGSWKVDLLFLSLKVEKIYANIRRRGGENWLKSLDQIPKNLQFLLFRMEQYFNSFFLFYKILFSSEKMGGVFSGSKGIKACSSLLKSKNTNVYSEQFVK